MISRESVRVEGTRKRGTHVVGVGVTRGWHVGAAHGRPRKGVMKVLRGGTRSRKEATSLPSLQYHSVPRYNNKGSLWSRVRVSYRTKKATRVQGCADYMVTRYCQLDKNAAFVTPLTGGTKYTRQTTHCSNVYCHRVHTNALCWIRDLAMMAAVPAASCV